MFAVLENNNNNIIIFKVYKDILHVLSKFLFIFAYLKNVLSVITDNKIFFWLVQLKPHSIF